MDAPKVSIVVPNYNHARFLRQRIDSIVGQTYQDFELILLDDCSTDDSRVILQEYALDPRVRLEFNDRNSGSTCRQWNKGIRLARGRYVWIAESDDYADPRLLERLVPLLDGDSRVTFAYSRSRQVLPDGELELFGDWYMFLWDPERWTKDFVMSGREMCERYFCRTNPVPNASAVLFRKEVYQRVGGADESMRICGDWKLWASVALEGRVAYLGEVLNYFRVHPNSVRNQTRISRVDVIENLQVTRWVLNRVNVSETEIQRICALKTMFWVPAVMSLSVPISLKRQVLREVWGLDRHPIRNGLGPALAEVRLKVRRHWREMRGQPT